MNKKTLFAIFMLFACAFVFMTGKSDWLIIEDYETQINTSYYPVSITGEKEATYNGNYLPFTENDIVIDDSSEVKFDSSLLEFIYYESIEDDNIKIMDHAPVNVGQYFVDVKYAKELISTISYVIKPYDVYIKLNDNTITYGDAPKDNGYSLYSDNAAETAFTFPTNVLENKQDTIGNLVYSYSYKQYGTVGNYNISIDFNNSNLNSNYTFHEINKSTLTVNKKDINFTWEDNSSWEYDGNLHHPSATLDPNGIVNKDQIVLEYNGVKTNAGTYTVELLNNLTNYNIIEDENNKFTKDYYITRREVTASWDNNTEFTYDNTNKKQAPAITLGNLVAGEDLTPVYEYYELIDGLYEKISSMPYEVGSYKVVLAGLENGANGLASNYKLPEETIEKEFEIIPLEVTINWENNEVTYNGENQYITVIPGDYKANDYKIVYDNNEALKPFDAKTYSVKFVTTNKNYKILNNSDETTFIINPKEIDLTWSGDKEVDLGIGMEYKGANNPVGPTPNLDNTQICEYDIDTLKVEIIVSTKNALANANNEGTVAFASKYIGEAALNSSNYVINNNKTCDYYVLRALMDSYFTNVNARTTIIPDFEFIYNASTQIPVAYINEADLKGNDAVFTPIVTPTLDGNETTSINVGNYLATITGLNNNNYELTANNTATYTISPKVIGAEWTNNVVDYNGNVQAPTLTITGLCGTDSVNGTISYSLDGNIVNEAKNAGIYTVTVASLDNSNYRLPIEGEDSYESITSTFTINKLRLTITTNNHTITYGDSAANNGVSYAGFLAGEDESVLTGELTYSYDKYIIGSPVGTYNITATGLEGINYEITYLPGTLTVEQLELVISWGNTSLEYNGKLQAPSPVFTNTLSGDDVKAEVIGQEREVGNGYTATISNITGSDSLNYKLPSDVSTTYNIIPKTIYLTKWDTTSYVFDGNNHSATATLSGVIADEDCYVTTTSYRNVGEYTVTAELSGTNKGNYVLDKEYTVTLEITPMDITINWSNLEFTYDGKAHKPTATLPTLIGNDQVTITVTGEQTNAGDNYTAGIELAGENKNNYNVTNPTQKFIINKAPLTVTANNHTITYGDSAANNGVTYKGFVNNETEAVLDITKLSYTYGNYSVGSNVGSYNITPTGIIAANYEITYVNGTLTVIAKDVEAEWTEEEEYIYSGVNQGPTAKVIGINNTELNVTITYDSINAGNRTASLSLSGDDALNYNITNPTYNYVIKKKALTIKANDYDLIYGDKVPQFEVSYEGFVNEETKVVLTGTLVFDTNYVQYANIGDYYINISGLSSNNYQISYTPGNIKVNEYSLTITWGVTSFVYNGEVQGPSATAEGLNNDQLTVNVTYDGVTVGNYTASATLVGDKADNYVISNPTIPYEITKAIYDMSKVSFTNNTVTYNGKAHNIVITGELPAGVTVEYEYKLNDTIIPSNEVINAGTYNVTAKFTGDSVNYELIENMTAVLTINKKEYNVSSLTWNYKEPFTYDKTEKSVELVSIPEGLNPVYENASATYAGNYIATVTFTYNEDNYIVTGTVAELEWVINKAVVTAPTADSTEFTYNGTEHTYTLETSDLYTISGNKQTNAGTYTVTVTLVDSSNYKWSDDKTNPLNYTFIINKAKLDKPKANDTVFTYNGLDQTYTLVGNDNYTISNNVQKNADTYTVLVEINDKDNYEWSDGTTDDLTYEFIINQATIDLSKAEWNYTTPFTYDKEEHEVVLSTIPSNITITSYSNNKATNAGNYTATVKEFTYDTVNYKLSGEIPSCSWVINKATIEAPALDTTVYTYNGKPQTYIISENENYKVENNVQTDAGTYTVTVSLIDSDNYEWSDNKTNPLEYVFIINKAEHEMSDVSFINTTQTYTGSALAITTENVPSGLTVSYKYYQNDTEIPAENVINAGTYKVIVSFTDTTGNYNNPGSIETTLIINKAQAIINVDQSPITITYGDELIIPKASTNFGIVTCDKTLEDMKNAGNYTITYTVLGTDNYIGDSKTVSVTINKAKVEKPETDNTIYTYNGSEQEYQLDDNSLYTITGNKQTNAGTYTVKVSLNDTTNYVWSDGTNEALEYSFVINKMTVSEPTVVGTYTYTGLEQTVELSGVESYMTVTNNTGTNADNYTVTVTLDDNHEWAEGLDGKISWTIAKKSLKITASSHNISYDDEVPTYSYTYEGFENNEDVTDLEGTLTITCPYVKGDNVGTYIVTASGVTSDNYNITFKTGTLNVERRKIDAPKANENEFIYNGEAQTYELALSKYYTISNNVQTNANTYTVEVTLISTTNCVWSDGTDSPLTYQFVIKKLEVAEPTVVGTYTYTGTAQTVALTGFDSNYMTIKSGNIETNAGNYTVTVTLDSNHTWANGSDGNISWTIGKAPLTITANSYTITYGVQAPAYAVTYDNFVNNEPTSVLTGTLSFTCSYVQGSKVGTYTITPSGLDSNNYAITYVNGTLTVNPIEVSEPTVSGTYTYNGNEQQVTLTGFNSSYMTIVSGDTGVDAGDYTIVISLNENYTWTSGSDGNVLWTIEKAIPSYELPTDITSTIGSKLGDVDLPDGFEWQNPEQILNSMGEINYLATYNLGDNNYEVIEDIEIAITVYQVLTMVINNAPVVYDGDSHEIEITLYYNGEEVEQSEVVSNLTIIYKLNDAVVTEPKAVGDYSIIINMSLNNYYMVEYNKQLTNNLTISNVNFSITLEKISVGDVTISYESTVRTWTQISTAIKEKLLFTDASGNIITLGSEDIISIESMTNGIYTYDSTNTSSNVAGSTYLATLKLESSNYMLENDIILVKYQTVKVNGIYYTIEDALNNTSSGTITLAGSATSATSYVETTFTNLENYPYNSYSYIINNRDLIVPYEDSTNYFNGTSVLNYNSSGKVYSALTINENIILSFTGSSKLVVAANIGYSQSKTTAACNRGVLVNDGTINMESSSTLYSYGYIKGTGLIDLKSGATAFDGMTIYDWPGGSAASQLYLSSSVFPIKKWSLHQNACNTKINSNSTYKAFVYLIMDDSVVYQEFDIIGNSSSTNYMFKFNNDPDGYIMKSATNADSKQSDTNLSSITGSNQVAGQRVKLDIHGTVVDGSIKFSIKMIFTVNIQTSTDKAIGVSYLDITIASGSDVTLGASSYSFLPGTKIEVEEGAKLTTNSGVKLQFVPLSEATNLSYTPVDQVDAKLINNGQVTINGDIGGLIETESLNAILNIAGSNSAGIKLFKSSTDTYTATVNAIGTIDGLNDQTFEAGGKPYVSTGEDGGYYWTQVSSDQIKEFIINYYDDDKSTLLGQKTIVTVGNDTVYTVTGGEFTANKLLYEFDTWVNSNGVDVTLGTTTINAGNSINLYAKWTPIEYTFVYTAGYEDNGVITDITSEITLNEKIEKFTVNSFVDNVLTITTIASYDGETTTDWYVGDSKTGEPVKQFTLDQFTKVLEQYNTTIIPLYCEFSSTKTYTISFDVSNYPQSGVTISSVSSMSITTLETKNLPTLSTYNNDTNYQYYLTGWTDGTKTYTLDETISGALLSSDITLTAVWTKKYSITYEQGTQLNIDLGVTTKFTPTIIYYIPGSDISILPTLATEQGHTFVGWTDVRVTNGTKTYSNNDTDITTSKFADGKILYASYSVNTYKLNISGASYKTVNIYYTPVNGTETSLISGTSFNNSITIEYGWSLRIQIDAADYTGKWYNPTYQYTKCTISNSSSQVYSGQNYNGGTIEFGEEINQTICTVVNDNYSIVLSKQTG